MSVVPRRPMTLEAFLAWEERQEERWEFDGFAPVAMAGGTLEHSAIQRNLIAATVFERTGDDWIGRLRSGDAVLAMPEIGVEPPLAELHEGVMLADNEAATA
ncbi:MAG: hypothetical protein AB7F35_09915 [Acetobacteraceae bacterium]